MRFLGRVIILLKQFISLILLLLMLFTSAVPAFAQQPEQAEQSLQFTYVFSTKNKLDMFEDAGTARPTGRNLVKNQDAVLLENLGEWSQILIWNEAGEPLTGFVKSAALKQRLPEESPSIAALTAPEGRRIPLYKSKNAKGTVLYRYHPGVRVQILALAGKGWVKVRLHAIEGYVKEDSLDLNVKDIQPASLPRVTVQHDKGYSLSLRAADSYKSAQISAVKNGEIVRVLGVGKEFAHVITENGLVGFMMASGLNPQPLFADVEAKASVPEPEGMETVINNPNGQGANLRAKGSSAGDVLGLYPNGTRVIVTGGTAWWKKVWVDGKTGYMQAKLLQDFEPKEGNRDPLLDEGETAYDWTQDDQHTWSTGP